MTAIRHKSTVCYYIYYTVDNVFWPLKLPIMGSLTYQKHVEGFTIKVKYTLEQATKAQRGSRIIVLLFQH